VPQHIAVIMDGNGRWARKRLMPRVAGHSRGVEALRAVTRGCIERGVGYLTVFAFSSENWRRPPDEVSFLMQLFLKSLRREVKRLHENGIRFRVIGDLSRFDSQLVGVVREACALTRGAHGRQRPFPPYGGGQLWRALGPHERHVALDRQQPWA